VDFRQFITLDGQQAAPARHSGTPEHGLRAITAMALWPLLA
jgi:hypothetical protein